MYEVAVRERGAWRLGGGVLRDVCGTYLRRPRVTHAGVTVRHSADLRMVVYLMVGAEVLVEGLIDLSLVPPAWRLLHLVWLALMVDAAVAFGAVTRRHPHRVDDRTLTVRAGLLDEFSIPLDLVAAVRRERVSVKGRGVRPVPDRPDAVACNVTGTAELVLDLREPLTLRLPDGAPLAARHLHLAADDPAAAHRALAVALA